MKSRWIPLGLVSLSACGGTTPPPSSTPPPVAEVPPQPPVPAPESPPPRARLAPKAHYLPSRLFRDVGGGKRGAVAADRRVLIDANVPKVVDAAPVDDLGMPNRIPDSLGGGYLFVGAHTVHFATAFDAPLVSVAASKEDPHGYLSVGVGLHEVLVSPSNGTPSLYELPSGKPKALAPKGVVEIFGMPGGSVAARGSKGELYFSAAGGGAWHRVNAPKLDDPLAFDGTGIVVRGAGHELRLDEKGHLALRKPEPGMITTSNVEAFDAEMFDITREFPSDGVDVLVDPMTHAVDADVAVMVRRGDLIWLDARDGRLKQKAEHAFKDLDNCFVVRGGMPSFASCDKDDTLHLFRIERPGAAPIEEHTFKAAYAAEFGETGPEDALSFAGRCDGTQDQHVCVRGKDGKWSELAVPATPPNAQMLWHAASPSGHVFALGFDQQDTLVLADLTAQRLLSVELPAWARSGVRWQNVSIEDDGTLHLLIEKDRDPASSAGVLVIATRDGSAKINAKQLEGQLIPAGRNALWLTSDGKLQETLDAGASFHEVAAPPGGVGGITNCVETGCELGPWQRVGWGD